MLTKHQLCLDFVLGLFWWNHCVFIVVSCHGCSSIVSPYCIKFGWRSGWEMETLAGDFRLSSTLMLHLLMKTVCFPQIKIQHRWVRLMFYSTAYVKRPSRSLKKKENRLRDMLTKIEMFFIPTNKTFCVNGAFSGLVQSKAQLTQMADMSAVETRGPGFDSWWLPKIKNGLFPG